MDIKLSCNLISYKQSISKSTGKPYSILLIQDGIDALKLFGKGDLQLEENRKVVLTGSINPRNSSIFIEDVEYLD